MKFTDRVFDAGARVKDADAVRYVQARRGADSAADFFGLGDGAASVGQFAEHWRNQGLTDKDLMDAVIKRITAGRLHPLQSLRISRLLNDPSEELEPEDKEVLIAQVLELEWPETMLGGTT